MLPFTIQKESCTRAVRFTIQNETLDSGTRAVRFTIQNETLDSCTRAVFNGRYFYPYRYVFHCINTGCFIPISTKYMICLEGPFLLLRECSYNYQFSTIATV